MIFNIAQLRFHKEYFLFLLPFFFVFHEYNENTSVVSLGEAAILYLKYVLITFAICFISSFPLKHWRKASVFTVLIMGFNFFFGAFHDAVKNSFGNLFITKYSVLIPVSIFSLLFLFIFIKRLPKNFNRFTSYCNALLLVLIVIDIANFAMHHLPRDKQPGQASDTSVTCDTCQKPDIYFIVADGYAGDQQLSEVLHFDNSAFFNALRSRGFHIITDSRSNYNLTPYSIASIVTMDYLPIKSIQENKEDLNQCFSLINANPLLVFLKNNRYKTENYSIFRFDDKPPLVHSQFLQVGEEAISSQTFLGRMEDDIGFNLITKYKFKWAFKNAAEADISRVEKLFEKTMASPLKHRSEPRFIYTHLMMPHYPYYFDKHGNHNNYEILLEKNWSLKKEYTEYLQYTNMKLLELFDQILSKSAKPPIVAFIGDHGFREFSSDEKDVKYYFMNMSAVYLPERNYANFYEGMSNVNQFRVILNTVFHQDFPLHSDSSILIK